MNPTPSTAAEPSTPGRRSTRLHAFYLKSETTLWWQSMLYLASKVVPAGLGLVVVVVFIRLLGVEIYGRYAVVAAIVVSAGNVGATWLSQSILRYQHSTRLDPREMSRAVWGGAAYSAAATGIVVVVVLVARTTSAFDIAAGVACAATGLYYAVAYACRQSEQKAGRIMVAETIKAAVGFLAPLVLVLLGWVSVTPLLLGLSAGAVAGMIALGNVRMTLATAKSNLRKFSVYGFPMTLWMAVSVLLNVSDRFIIDRFLGEVQVGVYSSIYDVTFKSTALLMSPVLLAVHPRIMRLANQGEHRGVNRQIWQTFAGSLGLGVLVCSGWFLLRDPIARWVLGSEGMASGATALVTPIAAGALVWQLAMILHKPLEIAERTYLMALLAAFALIVQVALNIVFIPRFGVVVAAYTTLASGVLYSASVGFVALLISRRGGRYE